MLSITKKTRLLLMLFLASSSITVCANPFIWAQSQHFEAKGDYVSAAALLEPFLLSGDNKEFAYLRYGWLNYLQGRYDVAVSAYSKALQLNPQSIDARLGISLPLLAQQRWQDAALQLKRTLAVSPWDYTAHVRLMLTEEAQQKWETLAYHATELNRRYPSDATILVYLARAHAWLGHTEKARQVYSQVLLRVPHHIEASRYLYPL